MKTNILLAVCIVIALSVGAQYKKYSFQQPKMGSLFNIAIYSLDSIKASQVAAHVFRMIDTLNQIYSDYIPSSELNRLCAKSGSGEWIRVSEPLFKIVQTAYEASRVSGGRFDVTMGPLVRLWRRARQNKRLPEPDSILAAKRLVGYRYIQLDATNRRIRLNLKGMQMDLGGIAKGETAQRAHDRLVTLGFPYSLVDAGGDIVAGTVPRGVAGWRVSINLPGSEELMQEQLLLRNKAVTTSGDLYQYVELNGNRYSHIIDPLTGYALTNSRNVTVISKTGVVADWLTKACSMMPIDSALLLARRFPSTEVQIAILKDGKPVFFRSSGFEGYFRK